MHARRKTLETFSAFYDKFSPFQKETNLLTKGPENLTNCQTFDVVEDAANTHLCCFICGSRSKQINRRADVNRDDDRKTLSRNAAETGRRRHHRRHGINIGLRHQ